jgi:hypothetical protein
MISKQEEIIEQAMTPPPDARKIWCQVSYFSVTRMGR